MELLSNLAFGFDVALSLSNLLYCFVGVVVGTFIGVLPGIGPMATISMLLPVTFSLDPIGAMIMLAGIYYGAMYGGSIAAILLSIPGSAASAVVCLDGHEMAKQGRAATALVMSAIGSFVAGSLAIVLVMSFAPLLAKIAVQFGPTAYCSMMLLALLAAAGLSQGSFLKGIGMVLLGIIVGLVGIDVNSGAQRFTFGSWSLAAGISFSIVAMGVFAIAEVVTNLEENEQPRVIRSKFAWRELIPPVAVLRQALGSMLRGFGVGSLFGILPGSGPTISTFISYSIEKRVSREPDLFGKGALEGVTGPESANNAASIAGFIPTLTLGVPGDAIMALMLGALMVFGITPGPRVIIDNPELFWGLVASMWIGNLLLLVLNIPFVGVWVRVLEIPYKILYPSILLFICIGVFSTNNNTFDVMVLAGFGAAGYILAKLDCPAAPLLLGLILGPLIETNMRRALLISGGDPSVFVTHPLSLAFLVIAALFCVGLALSGLKRRNSVVSSAPGE